MYKIKTFMVNNFGKVANLSNVQCSDINVLVGENSTGKTFLLKALYSAVRAQEDFWRGEDKRPVADILAEKLKWTFQVERIGDLVTKPAKEPLRFSMLLNDEENMGFLKTLPAKLLTSRVALVKMATLFYSGQGGFVFIFYYS